MYIRRIGGNQDREGPLAVRALSCNSCIIGVVLTINSQIFFLVIVQVNVDGIKTSFA